MGAFDLQGRVALLTGASRGLGYEMARALGEAGACVYINGRDVGRAAEAVERLRRLNIDARSLVFPVEDEAARTQGLAELVAQAGRLDILVNNVGVRFRRPFDEIDGAMLRQLLDVNLVAAFALTRACSGVMSQNRYGRIINISSVASERGRKGDIAYLIAKAGMNAMTRGFAAELADAGITCNAILAGAFNTETNYAMMADPDMQNLLKIRIPAGRVGQPVEIGGAAVFLASEAASYVTGAMLPVDGGLLMAA